MTIFSLPLHPSLVHFPIALLVLGALASLVYLWRKDARFNAWGFVSLLLGWVLTIPAIITGLIDKTDIPAGIPADQIANQHTTAIFAMWILFGLALYWQYRWRDAMDQRNRRLILTALLILGAIGLVLAGHLGARLVYELGVGVQTP